MPKTAKAKRRKKARKANTKRKPTCRIDNGVWDRFQNTVAALGGAPLYLKPGPAMEIALSTWCSLMESEHNEAAPFPEPPARGS